MLGNGGAALRPAGIGKVADKGADDAALVDAVMRIEAAVLGGNEGLLYVYRNVGERHEDAPVARLEHVGELPALVVEHVAQIRQFVALEPPRIGQIGRGAVVEVDHLSDVDDRLGDGFVLAELMVGGVEVGKIDAVEGQKPGAHRLGIVERGRDEFVEIDRFDAEGLAHMGAAGAQNLHHLR